MFSQLTNIVTFHNALDCLIDTRYTSNADRYSAEICDFVLPGRTALHSTFHRKPTGRKGDLCCIYNQICFAISVLHPIVTN